MARLALGWGGGLEKFDTSSNRKALSQNFVMSDISELINSFASRSLIIFTELIDGIFVIDLIRERLDDSS